MAQQSKKSLANNGLLLAAAICVCILPGCGKSSSDHQKADETTAKASPASSVATSVPTAESKTRTDFDQAVAAKLYRDNCAACHQPAGEGVKDIYPAFPSNPLLDGPIDPLLQLILAGRGGMPSFLGDMTPAEIALVTNHLRNEWSNQRDLVTADQVAAIAKGLNKASGDSRKDD